MYTTTEIEQIFDRRADTVYRVCYAFLRNRTDAEDAVQDTFVRLMRYAPEFREPEHEKAWLIRVASNVCKNMLKHPTRRQDSLDDHEHLQAPTHEPDATLACVLNLPERLKTCVYLHYYEGYSSVEIARLFGMPESTVRNRLRDARQILKTQLGDDYE
ncbi:MAG: RNA polymerase sigma factor [Oscillospiraceae bacterium]|nr:RNA polymerase sigma factor [Oscillospiraceae bacterium]